MWAWAEILALALPGYGAGANLASQSSFLARKMGMIKVLPSKGCRGRLKGTTRLNHSCTQL